MTQIFEFAAFTVHAGHEQALIGERPAMIAALRKAFPACWRSGSPSGMTAHGWT
jgi:hypothetical protein